jgi:hypothetical protein
MFVIYVFGPTNLEEHVSHVAKKNVRNLHSKNLEAMLEFCIII